MLKVPNEKQTRFMKAATKSANPNDESYSQSYDTRLKFKFIATRPLFPVELVVGDLPQLVVDVDGVKVLGVDEVAPVEAVGDEEVNVPVPEALAEGHVGVEEAGDELGPCLLVGDERAMEEVAGGDVGHVPEAAAGVLDDLHVVGGAGVESWREKYIA